jgi:hypothetical protein
VDRYPNDHSPRWLYSQALLRFMKEGPLDGKALRLRAASLRANRYVPEMLASTASLAEFDEPYLEVGGPTEAADYAMRWREHWRYTPGALAWLKAAPAPPAKPKR